MSGKSQTIGAFTFCRPSQIYRIIATILSLILPMNLAGNGKCAKSWNLRDGGTGAQQFGGFETIADVPDDTNLSFHLWRMIADHRRNLGRVGKIETLPILQICPRPFQTIGDIYDFGLENRERFYFPDASQISATVGDRSRQMKTQICIVGDIRRWISLISSAPNCWAPVPLSRKFQFFAHFPFPAISIRRIRDRIVAIIRYIWDGRQKVKSLIVWEFPDI